MYMSLIEVKNKPLTKINVTHTKIDAVGNMLLLDTSGSDIKI